MSSDSPLKQPIGMALPCWRPPSAPPRVTLTGRWARLEPLEPRRHGTALDKTLRLETDAAAWTYLPYGPFASQESFDRWLVENAQATDPLFYAIVPGGTGHAVGLASYLRITPASGSIEIGHLIFSPRLQRTAAATDAVFLLLQQAFALGYRRCEWKCDALNAPSRAAALRFGFTFEGVFRQATVYKGRNRDTAWYSVIDREWPALERIFRQWLDPSNFDSTGKQRRRLREMTGGE